MTYKGFTIGLLKDNIDTDQIIPKNYLKSIEKTGFGKYAFAEFRYLENGEENKDFPFNQEKNKNASILITGDNFGCGSSREHAAWALQELGIHIIIAGSYSDIFFNNWLNCGHWAIIADKSLRTKLSINQAKIEVDIEKEIIEWENQKYPITLLKGSKQKMQREGDFISEALFYEKEIRAFEQKNENPTKKKI